MGIFLSPKNFSSVRISQLKVQWFENYRDQNLPIRKFQPKKRLPKIVGDLYFHFLDVRKSQERQTSKNFWKKCSENFRSQIGFRTDIFRKLSLGAPECCEKPDVKTRSPCKEGFSSFPSLRPALKTFFRGPENELLQIWVCHCMAGNSPASMYISVISVVCRTSWIHKFRLNQLFS